MTPARPFIASVENNTLLSIIWKHTVSEITHTGWIPHDIPIFTTYYLPNNTGEYNKNELHQITYSTSRHIIVRGDISFSL